MIRIRVLDNINKVFAAIGGVNGNFKGPLILNHSVWGNQSEANRASISLRMVFSSVFLAVDNSRISNPWAVS